MIESEKGRIDLTPRMMEILQLVAEGQTNAEIGTVMGLSHLTVKNHVQKILERLGARNRQEAVWRALGNNTLNHPGYHSLKPISPPIEEKKIEFVEVSDAHIQAGDLVVYDSGRVQVGSTEMYLRLKERDLLIYFVQHLNKTFTRNHLLDVVWGIDAFIEQRTIDVYVARLRKHLGPDCDYRIRAVAGLGYQMVKNVEEHVSGAPASWAGQELTVASER